MPSCHPARSTGSQGRGVHVSHGTLHTHFLIRVPVHAMGQRVTLCEVHRKIMATKIVFRGPGPEREQRIKFPKDFKWVQRATIFQERGAGGVRRSPSTPAPKMYFPDTRQRTPRVWPVFTISGVGAPSTSYIDACRFVAEMPPEGPTCPPTYTYTH